MKTSNFIKKIAIVVVLVIITGCGLTEYDNYDKPKSALTGAVVYNGDTLHVRSGAAELELWQPGYKQDEKIPVSIAQDGTFSAKLFDGKYKLTQLIGDGPWVPNSDTTEFELNGSKNVQFEVEPYCVITSSSISKNGDTIEANFDIKTVNDSRNITFVTLFIGTGKFTSIQHNSFFWNQYQEGITINSNGSNTMTITLSQLPEKLSSRDYVFARICVEIDGKEDALYSKAYKINLKP